MRFRIIPFLLLVLLACGCSDGDVSKEEPSSLAEVNATEVNATGTSIQDDTEESTSVLATPGDANGTSPQADDANATGNGTSFVFTVARLADANATAANATSANATATNATSANATSANATAVNAAAANATRAAAASNNTAPASEAIVHDAAQAIERTAPEAAATSSATALQEGGQSSTASKAAEPQKEKQAAQKTPAAKEKAKTPAQPDTGDGALSQEKSYTLEELRKHSPPRALVVLAKFKKLARSWMHKLDRERVDGPDYATVAERGTRFVATYRTLDFDSLDVSVRPTGNAALPYTGRMSYYEFIHESRGGTEAMALDGPFFPIRKQKFTELFVFRESCNCWVN